MPKPAVIHFAGQASNYNVISQLISFPLFDFTVLSENQIENRDSSNPGFPRAGILRPTGRVGHGGLTHTSGSPGIPGRFSTTLDINLHQCPNKRPKQPVSSGQGKGPRLPKHENLHDDDLHDRQSRGFHPQIHMKRRRARILWLQLETV